MTSTKRRRRQPPSFWEVGGQHLLAELRATLGIMGLCAALVFLLTCLLVGIYHMLRAFLLFVLLG